MTVSTDSLVHKLDIGCGDGGFSEIRLPGRTHLASWLLDNGGPGSLGIDTNATALLRARERIRNGTEFERLDVQHLPFPADTFSVVHGFGVLHHVENWRLALAEVARVHRPGGTLELTETVDNWPPYRLARHLVGSWHGDAISSYFYSDDLLDALRRFYVVTDVRYCYRPLVAEFLRLVNKEPDGSLRLLAGLDKWLNRVGLGKHLAGHVAIQAVRK